MGVRADGSRFAIELTAHPVTYQNSSARIVRIRDLTRRRRAQSSLLASEERFRATFEMAPIGIAHVAVDGSWLLVNPRLCEIVGYSREELAGRSFQQITHPDDLDADLTRLNAVLAGEIATYALEKRYFRKDGSIIWVHLTVGAVRAPDGTPSYFISVVEDISARKAMEEVLRQSQKMEVVGQLTSSLAHDFGNFLNAIKGNLQLLESYQTEARAIDYLKSALAGSDMAESLIRQLLSVSRREEATLRLADANGLILEIEPLLRRAVGRGIKLVLELHEAPCWALCDVVQFETALLNLALNARDAMQPQATGTITIRTSVGEPAGSRAGDDRLHVRIDVTDSGQGMPADIVERACEPFFTTKVHGAGTGLGLSQVARTIRQMNGTLEIDSCLGKGTTVSLFLPFAD
jgi:PAS domain S-box-containing protein